VGTSARLKLNKIKCCKNHLFYFILFRVRRVNGISNSCTTILHNQLVCARGESEVNCVNMPVALTEHVLWPSCGVILSSNAKMTYFS